MNNQIEIRKIAYHYGFLNQLLKTKEELLELIEVVDEIYSSTGNIKNDVITHLAEEISDVRIMTDQLEILFNLSSKCSDMRNFKINRQLERIKNELANKQN